MADHQSPVPRGHCGRVGEFLAEHGKRIALTHCPGCGAPYEDAAPATPSESAVMGSEFTTIDPPIGPGQTVFLRVESTPLVALVRVVLDKLRSHVAETEEIRLDKPLMDALDGLRHLVGKESAPALVTSPWTAGAIGKSPEDDALVWRDDAVFGPTFYARSTKDAEVAAKHLNDLEGKIAEAEERGRKAGWAAARRHLQSISAEWAEIAEEELGEVGALTDEDRSKLKAGAR